MKGKPMMKPEEMMMKPKLGSGGRFAALEQELAGRPGVTDPAGLAAYIGRKKLGAKKFNALSAAARKKKRHGK